MNVTKTAKKAVAAVGKMLSGDPIPELLREEAAKLKLTGTRTQVWTAACDAAKRSDAVLADYKVKAKTFAAEVEKIKSGRMWNGNAEHADAEKAMNAALREMQHCKDCEAFAKAVAPDEIRDEYRGFHKRIGKLNQQKAQALNDLAEIQRRVDEASRQKTHRDNVVTTETGDRQVVAEVQAREAGRSLASAQGEMQVRREELEDLKQQIDRLTDREAKVKRELYQLAA